MLERRHLAPSDEGDAEIAQPPFNKKTDGLAQTILLRPQLVTDHRHFMAATAQAGRSLAPDEAGSDEHHRLGLAQHREQPLRVGRSAEGEHIRVLAAGDRQRRRSRAGGEHTAIPAHGVDRRTGQPGPQIERCHLAVEDYLDIVGRIPLVGGEQQLVEADLAGEVVLADMRPKVRQPIIGGHDKQRSVTAGLPIGATTGVAAGPATNNQDRLVGTKHDQELVPWLPASPALLADSPGPALPASR